ncbi:MAG: hypothetical protein UU87_C0003G0038 [Parcubacteria group bacterium GW2011_GWA2_42_11]|nr:MAG: hypothetical protein UU87_C0003G0038 [Parcubacteria group bacterium GW2011_GWA2_42_11]
MALTRQQFNEIKTAAWQSMNDREQKKCLLLAADLEPQINGLETSDPELYFAAKKIIAQLRWAGLPIIFDEELFHNLFRHYLLEGLELEDLTGDKLSDIATTKLSWQFGYALPETTQNILRAIRENTQPVGKDPLMVKNETKPARPVIRNWLVDFLRSSPDEPSEIDEMNYLYNNPNAKKLSPQDRKILSRILDFYDLIRFIAQETARTQRNDLIVNPEEAPQQARQTETAPNQTPVNPTQNLPASPVPPIQPPMPEPIIPRIPARPTSAYREPIEEGDLAGPPAANPIAPTPPKPTSPAQGNIVDLQNILK